MQWARDAVAGYSEIRIASVINSLTATTLAMVAGMDVVHAVTTLRCLASSDARAETGTPIASSGAGHDAIATLIGLNDAGHDAIATAIETGFKTKTPANLSPPFFPT